MTRRVHLQLAAIVSNDGTRCAAECPHVRKVNDEGRCFSHALKWSPAHHVDLGLIARHPACIAAEQAAASVPSCEGDETIAPREVQDAIAAAVARVDAASSGHLDDGARALDASEALAKVRRDGISAGYRIARRRYSAADETAALDEMHEEAAFAVEYVSSAVAAIETRHAEALREARVQGMREGFAIAFGAESAESLRNAIRDRDEAIEAVRKGER